MYADYMKPVSRFEYFNISKTQDEIFIGLVRKEQLPLNQLKLYARPKKEQKFNKLKSVFKSWTKDNIQILQKAADIDTASWKVSKMIKDKDDYDGVVKLIFKNYDKLKHIFISLISQTDTFPQLGLVSFGEFVR